jgi:hypothetical protein
MAKFKVGDKVFIDFGGIADPEIARKARVRGEITEVVPAGSWAAEGHEGAQMYIVLPDLPFATEALFEEAQLASE